MRPLILVTNDDGIQCRGLLSAASVASQLGDVLIVAPATRQTGMSRSFPAYEHQGIITESDLQVDGTEMTCFSVHGSPAQAVAHAVLELAPRHPELCISGVNIGENLGATNLISGTVGAAYEAACFGIPALAVSTGPEEQVEANDIWPVSESVVHRMAGAVLRDGLHPGVALLNINIPACATLESEIRITNQSNQNHYVCARPQRRDFSKPFRLPVTESLDFETLERDSDAWAFLVDGVVSVTPMGSDLTARNGPRVPMTINSLNSISKGVCR